MTYLADACALLAYFGTGSRAMTEAGCEALRANLSIITCDAIFAAYGVAIVW